MSSTEATMAVAMLATAYPNAKLDDPTRAELWIRMLSDVPGDALKSAVGQLICTSKFCPSIAEVREAATLIVSPASLGATPNEAWATVLNEIARVGWCGAPVFADPLIARAVQCTAVWYDLCTTNVEDMPSHRARFLEAYSGLQRKVREGKMLPDTLRRQIEDCRAEHQARSLEDARPRKGIPGGSAVARDALAQARAAALGEGDDDPPTDRDLQP